MIQGYPDCEGSDICLKFVLSDVVAGNCATQCYDTVVAYGRLQSKIEFSLC